MEHTVAGFRCRVVSSLTYLAVLQGSCSLRIWPLAENKLLVPSVTPYLGADLHRDSLGPDPCMHLCQLPLLPIREPWLLLLHDGQLLQILLQNLLFNPAGNRHLWTQLCWTRQGGHWPQSPWESLFTSVYGWSLGASAIEKQLYIVTPCLFCEAPFKNWSRCRGFFGSGCCVVFCVWCGFTDFFLNVEFHYT